jgi:hypothetical protein
MNINTLNDKQFRDSPTEAPRYLKSILMQILPAPFGERRSAFLLNAPTARLVCAARNKYRS